MSNPWLRLYTEAVDDEKLRLLAFEDRWHFIAILCCKGKGIIDETKQRPHAPQGSGQVRTRPAHLG